MSGIGKTSLIRSIVQLSEDIVHVDPLTPPTIAVPTPEGRKRKKSLSGRTGRITEIHASTKAYPPWWSDMEESRVLRRRKSLGDTVLERNICFVDTPGLAKENSSTDHTDHVIHYLEDLLHRNAQIPSMADSELLGVLTGQGGCQVDAVLYIFSPRKLKFLSFHFQADTTTQARWLRKTSSTSRGSLN